MVDPEDLEPPNAADDYFKVQQLRESMETKGWDGPPLVVHGEKALNGAHRLAAARQVGLSSIPTITIQEAANTIGADLSDYKRDGCLVTDRLMKDWYSRQ